MKFLCLGCDKVMDFAERQLPGDGTFAAVFNCGSCGHEIAMLANPMETQMVSSLGVKIGGRTLEEQPMELVRTSMADGRPDAFIDPPVHAVGWDPAAVTRIGAVPSFVRGMVKRIYTDYAREKGISLITPSVMDRARSDLGLEEM